MGQQPNIHIPDAEKPRSVLQPPSAVAWRSNKPGLINAPDQVPTGGRFGTPGPDAGWGLLLLANANLPDDDPKLAAVVEGLMMARAARAGRAPLPEDIEVALVLCGYGYEAPADIIERRERWLSAVPHESRPGSTAVAEVDPELIVNPPEKVRWALTQKHYAG
jgi:hypothetical protein